MSEEESADARETGRYANGFIYTPENVRVIREEYKDSKVAIIDANGVLCSKRRAEPVNMEATEALIKLKNAGFKLVLWTSAGKVLVEQVSNSGLNLGVFDLIITAENYYRNQSNKADFISAVNGISGLSEIAKKNMVGKWEGNKTPQVFFPGGWWIEDGVGGNIDEFDECELVLDKSIRIKGGQYEEVRQGIENTGLNYRLVEVCPFGESEDNLRMVERSLLVFGPELVNRLLEK